MKNFKKVSLVLLVAVMFMFAGMSELWAKGRSSSSRSSSRSSSKSRPTTTSKSRPSSSNTRSKTSVKPTTKKRTTTAPKRTATQQKSFEASKKNGTSKMTKTQSMNKFKSDPAMQKKYTSKYASKPTTRPSHIPATTNVGGQNVNINYNSGMGGFGYTNTLGAFIMYDMMADTMMRDRMMTSNGYLYAGHPNIHRSGGFGILGILLSIVGVVIVCVVVGAIIKSSTE